MWVMGIELFFSTPRRMHPTEAGTRDCAVVVNTFAGRVASIPSMPFLLLSDLGLSGCSHTLLPSVVATGRGAIALHSAGTRLMTGTTESSHSAESAATATATAPARPPTGSGTRRGGGPASTGTGLQTEDIWNLVLERRCARYRSPFTTGDWDNVLAHPTSPL